MKNLSDEELIDTIDCFGFDKGTYIELKYRLERGGKAIEAMEKFSNLLNDLKGLNYIIDNLSYSPDNRYFMIAETTIYANREASELIKNRMKYNGRETTDEN